MYIFLFRRDLRIVDNIGFNRLVDQGHQILPIFIMNPEQISRNKNEFFSDKSVQFMSESLKDLDMSIKKAGGKGINLFYGNNLDVLNDIVLNNDIEGICLNEDYTPYSRERDLEIAEQICFKNDIEFLTNMDIPLYNFKLIETKGGTAYKRFKWFHHNTKSMGVNEPINLSNEANFYKGSIISDFKSNFSKLSSFYKYNPNLIVKGGRTKGLAHMKNTIKKLKNYKAVRQTPLMTGQPTSSLMSAYLKFGCVSIREMYYEVYNHFGAGHELIRQMVWRDFYYNIVWSYPETFLDNKHSYIKDFPWSEDYDEFQKWCDGRTGFPFVDASMRQLNKEGYMSNRGRLSCASFLIRNLHIDWKWGEKYFATQLVDYDPSQNNGNWQWVSSSGMESQAYYRYINPEKDLTEFDPYCIYVKKYIPELKDVECHHIHSGNASEYSNYIEPMVDVKETFSQFKDIVKSIK